MQKLQDSLAKVFNPLLSKQIIDGRLMSGLSLVSGTPLEINHGLGRAPRGWIVARKTADANVWESDSSAPAANLVLNADATVTINIWVF